MAIQALEVSGQLVIRVENGVNNQGAIVYAARRYDNIKPSAAAEDVYAVAQALVLLQTKPVAGIQKVVTYDLVEEN